MDKEIGEILARPMYTERPEVKKRLLEYSQAYSEVKRKRLLEPLSRRAPNTMTTSLESHWWIGGSNRRGRKNWSIFARKRFT